MNSFPSHEKDRTSHRQGDTANLGSAKELAAKTHRAMACARSPFPTGGDGASSNLGWVPPPSSREGLGQAGGGRGEVGKEGGGEEDWGERVRGEGGSGRVTAQSAHPAPPLRVPRPGPSLRPLQANPL